MIRRRMGGKPVCRAPALPVPVQTSQRLRIVPRIFMIALAVGFAAASARGGTNVLQPGDSIQAAVNAANDGDTIVLSPGVYTESVTIPKGLELTIRGSGAAETVWKAASVAGFCITSSGSGTQTTRLEVCRIHFKSAGACINWTKSITGPGASLILYENVFTTLHRPAVYPALWLCRNTEGVWTNGLYPVAIYSNRFQADFGLLASNCRHYHIHDNFFDSSSECTSFGNGCEADTTNHVGGGHYIHDNVFTNSEGHGSIGVSLWFLGDNMTNPPSVYLTNSIERNYFACSLTHGGFRYYAGQGNFDLQGRFHRIVGNDFHGGIGLFTTDGLPLATPFCMSNNFWNVASNSVYPGDADFSLSNSAPNTSLSDPLPPLGPDPKPLWHSGFWSWRQRIEIAHSNVHCRVYDFPVLLTEANVHTSVFEHARPDGSDLLFTTADASTKSWRGRGQRLDHEIEQFDPTSRTMRVWVQVGNPWLSADRWEDTPFFMYYGNPLAADQQRVTGTWNSAEIPYNGVWHLNEAGGLRRDSSAGGNHGTPYGGLARANEGRIAGAAWFNGADAYLDMGDPADGRFDAAAGQDLSVSFWFNAPPGARPRTIVNKYDGACGYYIEMDASGRLSFYVRDALGSNLVVTSAATGLDDGAWHHCSAMFDSKAKAYLTIDRDVSASVSAASVGGAVANAQPLRIGYPLNGWYRGCVDELRIGRGDTQNLSTYPDTWVRTRYANESSPASFSAFRGIEVPPGAVIRLR